MSAESEKWLKQKRLLRTELDEGTLQYLFSAMDAYAAERTAAAEARITMLEQALRKYGSHNTGCSAVPGVGMHWRDRDKDFCNCGLAAALARPEKKEKP